MEGKRVIQSIGIRNLLSYGDEETNIELLPLNVLIGPNSSGKSNFLEVFRLLQAMPTDISKPIIAGGGINEWLWKGTKQYAEADLFVYFKVRQNCTLKHGVALGELSNKQHIVAEDISLTTSDAQVTERLYRQVDGHANITSISGKIAEDSFPNYGPGEVVDLEGLLYTQSILAQRSDPRNYPDLYFIADTYKKIGMYADVNIGRNTPVRQPQKADLDSTYLFEDGSNLALVINDLQNRPGVMRNIITRFKKFNPRVQDIITRVSYGTVQIFIEEEGLKHTLPATRLSDGALRYLFLLALLCHPEPPPILCIEEPELGLHPDMIRSIAELLIAASQRTQIITTTHSDLLVSALSEVPESVVVCEHDGESSTLRRLQSDKLNLWLEKYSLGELWLKGEIGGTRW